MIARLLKFPQMGRGEINKDGDTNNAIDLRDELTPQEREFLPSLLEIQETPPPPYQRVLVWTLAALVAITLLWSIIGHLDVVSTAPGRLIPDGRIKVMQVTETAIVKAIHVREGQQVKQGDLLLELDPTLAGADLNASEQNLEQNHLDTARLMAELEGGDANYGAASREHVELEESLRRADQAAYLGGLNSARMQLSEKKAAFTAAQITLRKLAALRDIAQEKEHDAEALLQDKFISRVEYLKDQQDWISADQDYAAQIEAVAQAEQAAREAEQQIALVQQEHRADVLKELNQNAANLADLQSHYNKANEIHKLKWLRAPVSGNVQSVSVTTTGGVVTPAQNLVTIVPEGTTLIVEASLSNDDIGYVKVGQPVALKIDTYPFQKYGTLNGKLSWISPDAEQPKDATANASFSNSGADRNDDELKPDASASSRAALSYRVHVAIDPNSQLIVNGRPAELKPGMTLQADIQTSRRRIYEFFLAPLVKYLDEGTHVR